MRFVGKIYNRRLFLFVVPVFVFFFILTAVPAGAVHKGAGGLTCGQCHTMHNSQGGSSLEGNSGGSMVLLRGEVSSRAEIHKLCLQCHATNGSMANVSHGPQGVQAPKVYSTGTWAQGDPFNQIGAGGNFSTELDTDWTTTTADTLGYGHSLGATNVTPPGGDLAISEFSCTNCHDPHGTNVEGDSKINIFRNLKVDATGAGANSGTMLSAATSNDYEKHISYVGGVSGLYYSSYFGGSETDGAGNTIWPVYRGTLTGTPSTDSSNSNSYGYSPYSGGTTAPTISNWCAQCHDNWHEAIATTNKVLDWSKFGSDDLRQRRRHPVTSIMPVVSGPGCAVSCHKSALDRTNYTMDKITAGKGVPVTTGVNSSIYGSVYYLPWDTPATTQTMMDLVGPGVFCLTCHFAHGGPYMDNLRWDYLSSVASGSQTANSMASDQGCQLCHNR